MGESASPQLAPPPIAGRRLLSHSEERQLRRVLRELGPCDRALVTAQWMVVLPLKSPPQIFDLFSPNLPPDLFLLPSGSNVRKIIDTTGRLAIPKAYAREDAARNKATDETPRFATGSRNTPRSWAGSKQKSENVPEQNREPAFINGAKSEAMNLTWVTGSGIRA
jgi:hypothetical protein